MGLRLFVVHGSHPCAAVERALDMKGLDYSRIELPPPLHAPIQRILFGRRTVPALVIDGERLSGSVPILHRLDALRPDPPLYPADPAARARVEEAERWGDEVFQPLARRLLWLGLSRDPHALPSYNAGSRLPLPDRAVVLAAPVVARAERALNDATEEAARADLDALPGHLARIDVWAGEGTIGSEPVNAADLQVATTTRLLMTIADLRPLIEPRAAGRLALRLFPAAPGELPAGALPAEWLPGAAAR